MKTKSAVPGVDLSFRPASYFWPLGLETHLLATIKGAERKAALKQLIDSGRVDEITDLLSRSALSEAERQALGQIHPAFMGGEFLPDLVRSEVEIARITIASVTQDVTSVYARRGKKRIYYRVVDEYEGDTLSEKRTRTSTRPLTLGELEAFLNGAWSIFDNLEMNFGDDGYDLEKMLRFVVGVDSSFYPNLDALYRRRIVSWAAERQRERRSDQDRQDMNESPTHEPVSDEPPSPSAPLEKRTGLLSATEGAMYSKDSSTAVSFGYFRTPDGKPPKR